MSQSSSEAGTAMHCTESLGRAGPHEGACPRRRMEVDRPRWGTPQPARPMGSAAGTSLMKDSDMTNEIENTHRLAEHVGLKLIVQRDGRSGRFRLQHGRDIVCHSDDLKDLQKFALGWRCVV